MNKNLILSIESDVNSARELTRKRMITEVAQLVERQVQHFQPIAALECIIWQCF